MRPGLDFSVLFQFCRCARRSATCQRSWAAHFGHACCARLLLDGGAGAAATATGANDVIGSQAGDDALAVAPGGGHADEIEIEALLLLLLLLLLLRADN